MEYAIVTIDDYEQSVEFYNTKRELNKAVKEIIDTAYHSNQYERYICKVMGMVDYTKKVKHAG